MAIVGLLAWKKALVAMQTETPALADSPAVS
jgi:hypothetical protein